MGKNLARKLIESHLADGDMRAGEEIGLVIDQTLTQDATGTVVMLEFEAMRVPRVKTRLSVQYVDHNLLQTDFKNADDHLFLLSACRKFGVWYSRPGNGVSHPVHMERFGVPGQTLLGSDSHTPAAGAMGMLAMGAGGLEVALAMAGEPVFIKMPEIMGVKLSGKLPDWVSAKDVILEMLRRHGVKGGVNKIVEYYGPGLANLSAMDRHVIANMGTELGATSTVFPSDDIVRRFLKSQEREDAWTPLEADEGADYDHHDEIDLSRLAPPDRAARQSGQRCARQRGGRTPRLPGIWVFRQPGHAGFRSACPDGGRPRVFRYQPDIAPDPGKSGRRGIAGKSDTLRRPHPSGRLQRVHRYGPGPGHGQDQPANPPVGDPLWRSSILQLFNPLFDFRAGKSRIREFLQHHVHQPGRYRFDLSRENPVIDPPGVMRSEKLAVQIRLGGVGVQRQP